MTYTRTKTTVATQIFRPGYAYWFQNSFWVEPAVSFISRFLKHSNIKLTQVSLQCILILLTKVILSINQHYQFQCIS